MLVGLLCSTRDMYQYRIHVIQINITEFKRNVTSTHLRTLSAIVCVFWLATVILWIYDIFIIFLVKWWKTPCKYKKAFMAHSWLSHVLRWVCKCMNIFGAERPVLDISDIETLTLPTLQFWRAFTSCHEQTQASLCTVIWWITFYFGVNSLFKLRSHSSSI